MGSIVQRLEASGNHTSTCNAQCADYYLLVVWADRGLLRILYFYWHFACWGSVSGDGWNTAVQGSWVRLELG